VLIKSRKDDVLYKNIRLIKFSTAAREIL